VPKTNAVLPAFWGNVGLAVVFSHLTLTTLPPRPALPGRVTHRLAEVSKRPEQRRGELPQVEVAAGQKVEVGVVIGSAVGVGTSSEPLAVNPSTNCIYGCRPTG
jgi:hypothetical protein